MPIHSNTIYFARQTGDALTDAPFVPVNTDPASLKRFSEQVDNLLTSKEWACRTLGQFELSYDEALRCEEMCRAQMNLQVPSEFWRPILQYVHGKVQSLQVLVPEICTLLQHQFVIGEKVQIQSAAKEDEIYLITGRSLKGRPAGHDSPTGSKIASPLEWMLVDVEKAKNLRYSLQLILAEKNFSINCVSFEVLRRMESKIPIQKVIRMFIRTFAYKLSYYSGHHPWLVDRELQEKFMLIDNRSSPKKTKKGPKKTENESSPPAKKMRTEKLIKKKSQPDIRQYFQSNQSLDKNCSVISGSSSSRKNKSATVDKYLSKSPSGAFCELSHEETDSDRLRIRLKLIEVKLERLLKEKTKNPRLQSYQKYADLVARQFTANELEALKNESIRNDVLQRRTLHEQRVAFKNMTSEQKVAYMKHQKEERRLKVMEEKTKMEDDLLMPQTPLPPGESVELPDGFTDKMFGEALQILGFVHSFAELLDIGASLNLSVGTFVAELAKIQSHNDYLNQLLLILVRPLLNDPRLKKFHYFGLPLVDVELNSLTVIEFTRLVLKHVHQLEEEDAESDDDAHEDRECGDHFSTVGSSEATVTPEVSNLINALQSDGIAPMTAELKISVYLLLIDRLLECGVVRSYLDKLHSNLVAARHRHSQCVENCNEFYKELLITKPGKSADCKNGDDVGISADDEEANKITTSISERQHAILQNKANREEQQKEAQLISLRTRLEKANKALTTMKDKYRRCFRLACLGTDRNMDRYWFFGSWAAGLFAEKLSGLPVESSQLIPTSIQWRRFGSENDIDELIEALMPKGIREFALKNSLVSAKSEIVNSMKPVHAPVEADEHTPTSVNAVIKDELLELCQDLAVSGLRKATVDQNWMSRVDQSETLQDFTALVVDLQQHLKRSVLAGVWGFHTEMLPIQGSDEAIVQQLQEAEHRRLMHLKHWTELVSHCNFPYRLLFLLYVMKAYINWDHCATKARCRVCRKTGVTSSEFVFNCDGCNLYFHKDCLRVDTRKRNGSRFWFCAACKHLKKFYLLMLDGQMLSQFASFSDRSLRKSRSSVLPKEVTGVSAICCDVLKKVTLSRLASSLAQIESDAVVGTRSRRRRGRQRVSTLREVQQSLMNYESTVDFFYDLRSVILHAEEENQNRQRTLDQLQQLRAMVDSLEAEHLPT